MPGLSISEASGILADMFAPWVLDLGLTVEDVGDESAVLRMAFSDRLCRVGGMVCGQAMVSAADTAMVLAISAAKGGFLPIGTVDMTVNYMKPAVNSDMLVDARVMRIGRTLGFCSALVRTASDGKDCAHVVGTYAMPADKPVPASGRQS